MTPEEARAYFIDSNEKIVSVAKDENRYNYETQQIEDAFMRRDFEANTMAIEALPSVTPTIPEIEDNFDIGYNCGYADAMCDIGGED